MTSSCDFSFNIRRQLTAVVVTVSGELDISGATRLGAVLGDLIEGQGNQNVVVDVRDIAGVDPAGLGVLGAAAKVANHHGGQLTLSDPSDDLYLALEATGIAGTLAVVGDDEDGLPEECVGIQGPASRRRRREVATRQVADDVAGDGADVNRPGGQAHGHMVEFYESDEFLGESVCRYIEPAFRGDDVVIVVATDDHRRLFEATLIGAGLDVEAARTTGRYTAVDAEETLSLFMLDGAPDPVRFETTVGGLVARAASGGRTVRVYGEMVAVLWAQGNVAAAIALEDLWNDLGRSQQFSLFCAYPLTAFDGAPAPGSFRTICEQHATVVPTERDG